MSFRQLLEVSDALERKPAGPAPFQPATGRVIPTFGRSNEGASDSSVALARSQLGAVVSVERLKSAGDSGAATGPNRNRRRHTPGRVASVTGNVPVVRNDFSDTDFLIVSERPDGVSAGQSVRKGASLSRFERFWDKCSARLLSLGLGWFKSLR